MKFVKHTMAIMLLLTVVLAGCNAEKPAVTGKQVIEAFTQAGIQMNDIKDETADTRASPSPLPKSFKENWTFVDPRLNNGKGGQVFVCDEKLLCDAIFGYFDILKGLAGPYLYRNSTGTVVLQLNSDHTPENAKQYQDVLSKL
ncbi:MAG: hypothetical protein BWK73_04825 [Thiothrix lacustris]|uniref:Lipoprotein n=1 Tax=Thiothrix lacustris TaxID=525917 RepID=A0A1Y1QYB0_9GAMM|nr:MAG: hypothetical protein BWK73_04825 [Thiothrix lacustris]